MPLLDAALAFALTMLALSSLAGLILRELHRLSSYREKQLKAMLKELFEKEIIPAAEQRLEGLSAKKADELKAKLRSAEAEAEASDAPDAKRRLAWLKVLGGSGVLSAIDDEALVSLTWDELVEKLHENARARQMADFLDEEMGGLIGELSAAWERVGARFTASFREHARLYSIGISFILALGLNIDTFYLLNAYMTDESATEAVLAQQSAILATARPADGPDEPLPGAGAGPRVAGDSGADPETGLGAIRQQALALQSDNLALGWSLFPNCPPNSSDPRCIEYWQSVEGKFDITGLGFADRQALSPPQRLRSAVASFFSARAGDSVAPPNDIAHTATEGGRGGGDLARRPAVAHGRGISSDDPWPTGALGFWLLGCMLTAVLAGQGSPFWYEVVSSLGSMRDRLRQRRKALEQGSAPPAAPGSPSSPVAPPPAGETGSTPAAPTAEEKPEAPSNPTTGEPTTGEPTTEEPTTEEPATEESTPSADPSPGSAS